MNQVEEITAEVAKEPHKNVPAAKTLRYTVAASVSLVRTSLLSSGIMVGVAFGFLGFALFVMGITGAVKMDAGVQGGRVLLENAAPGLVVLAIAAILIIFCIMQRVNI